MDNDTNKYKFHGNIKEVMPTKTFTSGFRTRDFVCVRTVGKYDDYAVFTAKKDMTDALDTLRPGDEVTVSFALEARPWDGPNGRKWFGTNVAYKIDTSATVSSTQGKDAVTPEPVAESDDDDAMPF